MGSISDIMFAVPFIVAVVFSLLTITPKSAERNRGYFSAGLVTFLCSLLASVSWFIFGLTWSAIAELEMFVSVGYLWFGLGVIFAIFTVYIGLRMLTDVFEEKIPRLKLEGGF